MFLRTVLLGLITGVISQAGIVTSITLANFSNPTVLDFQSVPTGVISGTNSYFTNSGVASITAARGGGTDTFDSRTNSSRALWVNTSGNLVVVDPGATNLDNNPVYTINLVNSTLQFGFGVHDQQGTYTVTFFQGATNVGTTTFTPGSPDLDQVYFHDTQAFNRVQISVNGGGFAIDNITFTNTPEPATIWLSGAGLAVLGLRKRRRV